MSSHSYCVTSFITSTHVPVPAAIALPQYFISLKFYISFDLFPAQSLWNRYSVLSPQFFLQLPFFFILVPKPFYLQVPVLKIFVYVVFQLALSLLVLNLTSSW